MKSIISQQTNALQASAEYLTGKMIFMGLSILPMCASVDHSVPDAWGVQKWASEPLDLELHTVVSHNVDSGN